MSAYLIITENDSNTAFLKELKTFLSTFNIKTKLKQLKDDELEDKVFGIMMNEAKNDNEFNWEDSLKFMKKSIANHGGKNKKKILKSI